MITNEILKEYLRRSNIDPNEEISIPHYSKLIDCEKASKRVFQALENGENIGIYGDYDVDGTTSIATLYIYLSEIIKHNGFKSKISTYQPDRFIDGYGLHKDIIKKAKQEDKVDLLITVDCGITAISSAVFAKEIGLELIITDHHENGSLELPYAHSVVNPKRFDSKENELSILCGCAVAFYLSWAINDQLKKSEKVGISLKALTGFVCLATIGDRVPMQGVNIELCKKGLVSLNSMKMYSHLKTLVYLKGNESIDFEKVGFQICPILNAKGRLGDMDLSLKFLLGNYDFSAIKFLQNENKNRKDIQRENTHRALEALSDKSPSGVFLYVDSSIHEGVAGLVAGSLVRSLHYPCICLTYNKEKDCYKGSARSTEDFNLYDHLSQINSKHREEKGRDLFISFGGHKMACGMSLRESELEYLQENLQKRKPCIIDKSLKIELSEVFSSDFQDQYKTLFPFGEKREAPEFKSRATLLDIESLGKNGDHFKLILKDKSTTSTGLLFFWKYSDKIMKLLNRDNLSLFLNKRVEITYGVTSSGEMILSDIKRV
jgi:single-stranded-DNA-specific exonuclease